MRCGNVWIVTETCYFNDSWGGLSTEGEEVGTAPLPESPLAAGSGLATRVLPRCCRPGCCGASPGCPQSGSPRRRDARGTQGGRVLGRLCEAGEGPRRKWGFESWGRRRPPRAPRSLGRGRAVQGWTQPCSRFPPRRGAGTPRLRARHVTPRHPFSGPVSQEITEAQGRGGTCLKGQALKGGRVSHVAVYYLEAA